MPFAVTWMDLEGIMLSKISSEEKDKNYDITYKGNQKLQQTTEYNKNEADTDIEKKKVVTTSGEKEGGRPGGVGIGD